MDDKAAQQFLELARIFQPHSMSEVDAMREIDPAKRKSARFAYYTSADTALKVIKNRTIWMRDVRCMNDYSEVVAGYQHVRESSAEFIKSLDELTPGLTKAVSTTLHGLQAHLQEVYICCLSEHLADEDLYGRLSMWRAYSGGSAGVAFVIRLPLDANIKRAEALRAPLSKVAYYGAPQFAEHMKRLLTDVRNRRSQLAGYPPGHLHIAIASALLMLSVASKHPGFGEEREWRLAHIPSLGRSSTIKCEIETVQGIPQRVYKYPLKNDTASGVTGIDIAEILDRVIIGPCTYAHPLKSALLDALAEARVPDPGSRVCVSDIPLRTNV